MIQELAKSVKLTNHKTHEEKEFVLRPFCCGDEEAVLKCVQEEYGDSYYRREYYDRALLLDMVNFGKLHLFVAYCGDDICGIQSLISHAPKEQRLEAASQIFRRAYRGYGLPYELVKYTYHIAKDLHPSCIYASMVVFHSITQKMCEDAGMKATAFNLGSHITSKMQNSFSLGSSDKYAQAIMILPVDKKDVGTVYINAKIADVAGRIYDDLAVAYNIDSTAAAANNVSETVWDISVNEREQSITVTVDVIGADLIDVMRSIKEKYFGQLWTIQLILPIDRPCAVNAYDDLKREGFFFTGLRPLCAGHEQMIMQFIGSVRFCFDDFKLTDGFRSLLEDVKRNER